MTSDGLALSDAPTTSLVTPTPLGRQRHTASPSPAPRFDIRCPFCYIPLQNLTTLAVLGGIAQSGERINRTDEVGGSSPPASTGGHNIGEAANRSSRPLPQRAGCRRRWEPGEARWEAPRGRTRLGAVAANRETFAKFPQSSRCRLATVSRPESG